MKHKLQEIPVNPPTQMGIILGAQKVIPFYQREYVWDDVSRDNLVENILEAFEAGDSYFIGSMVFQNRDDGKAQVVDGQQRLTTIFIFLAALVKVVKARDLSAADEDFLSEHATKNLRRTVKTADSGTRQMAMLQHADTAIIDAYRAISQGKVPNADDAPNMVVNLAEAYSEMYELLSKRLADITVDQLTDLIQFINTKLLCIHYVAEDTDTALTIYARLNSSGKVLTKLEILKGMSFQEAEQDETVWDSLHEKWLIAERTLQEKIKFGEKLTERIAVSEDTLLLYMLFLDFPQLGQNAEGVKNAWAGTKIGPVIFGKEAKALVKQSPVGFVDSITAFAREIQNLRQGNSAASESINNYLKDIALVAQTQSQWLMMGIRLQRHFPDSDEAFRVLRNMVFVFSFALTGSGSASGIYRSLAEKLAPDKDGNSPSLDDLTRLIDEMKSHIDSRWQGFVNEVSQLTYTTKAHHKLIRRILEFVEVELNRETDLGNLSNLGCLYRSKSVHVDHLQPTVVQDKAKKLPSKYQNQIGNPALLEKTYNTSLQNSPFESKEKQDALGQSKYLATRVLATSGYTLQAGKNKFLKKHFGQHKVVNAETVASRTDEIIQFLGLRLRN